MILCVSVDDDVRVKAGSMSQADYGTVLAACVDSVSSLLLLEEVTRGRTGTGNPSQ